MLDGGAHFYDSYETSDGKFIAIGSVEPDFYALLLELLGLQDDLDFSVQMDQSRWPMLKEKFTALFKTRTRDNWCALHQTRWRSGREVDRRLA